MVSRSQAALAAAMVGLSLGSVAAAAPWGSSAAALRGHSSSASLRLRGGSSQLAAYMLCRMGGNDAPAMVDVKNALESVGAKVEEDKIEKIVAELNGKDIDAIKDMINQGRKQYNEINGEYNHVVGGGGSGGGGGGGFGGSAAAVVAEEVKDVKKESSEASDMGSGDDMGFGLFD